MRDPTGTMRGRGETRGYEGSVEVLKLALCEANLYDMAYHEE